MIHVKRTDEPTSLTDNAATWTREYIAARTAERNNPSSENKKGRKKAEGKYAQTDVKKALNAMFHRKCAFCERKRDYPHIEHFYPKTDYPERCFEWANLLSACEVCNGAEFKGTKFPLSPNGTPLFINPCEDEPDEHLDFVFELDDIHPDGFVAVIREKTIKGGTTWKALGLNRPNLIEERNEFLSPYFILIAIEAGQGDQKSKKLLKRACNSKSLFAAFARALWRQFVGNYP